jgi:hypothetical protein
MNGEQIKGMQRRINERFRSGNALVVDGFWGSRSIPMSEQAVRAAALRRRMGMERRWII